MALKEARGRLKVSPEFCPEDSEEPFSEDSESQSHLWTSLSHSCFR